MDLELVRELRDLNLALAEVQREESGQTPKDTTSQGEEDNDPWSALLDIAAKNKRITVIMYESNVWPVT